MMVSTLSISLAWAVISFKMREAIALEKIALVGERGQVHDGGDAVLERDIDNRLVFEKHQVALGVNP
jgi:hypothetical protein